MENTRELIISSAFSFYTKPMMKNVSLENIAARAGITKPAIYRHFKNRKDLDNELENRIFKDIYDILSRVCSDKNKNKVDFIEDLVILLLSHKEYFFYLLFSKNNFTLYDTLIKLKKHGLFFVDSIFATDGSVTNIEDYKKSVFITGNLIFFECIYYRLTEKKHIQNSYSEIVQYASKISNFIKTGLNQDVSKVTVLRLANLDNICSSNLESIKPVNKIFASISKIVQEKGFQGITVESVAHGIGLAKSSMYTKFESKTEMISSLIFEEINELLDLIVKNCNYADTNIERGYVIMETVLLYFMKKPEVLFVGHWIQFHAAEEKVFDKKYDNKIKNNKFYQIRLFDNLPDLGLANEDKSIICSWFMIMAVILYINTKNQNISVDMIQAMLKDILIMMEKGV